MHITVKLFANLKAFAPVKGISGTPFEMEVPEPFTLGELIELLHLPAEEVKINFVNGITQPLDWLLQPGDQIGIFPPIGGG
ncbi:MAG: MoaD/ThiS family protein [Anaerolineaceae bacterium]|nr:MoaD/ThiS family protein [Anaerolineaceae bacterium]